MRCVSISCAIFELSAGSMSALAETLTCSLASPTRRDTDCVAVWLTSSVMPT